jgi:predicted DNA binding CopG/RHH family protein
MPKKRRNYEELGEFEMPPELVNKVEAMIVQADAEDAEARVNFRWGKEQVDVVKQAAKLMGIPYQTFIKQTVFERALGIIKDMQAAKTNSAA